MTTPITHWSARRIRDAVATRACRATDVAAAFLDRIAVRDGELRAFVEVYADRARRDAARLDAALDGGAPAGPLAGVPFAIKDNFAHRGDAVGCGSRILDGYRSPFTATAVERLLAAGAILIGRTNMDEFAMGSSTEHSAEGPTRNPFDPARTPGGSSGGSAAAVAARLVPLALGSDTGGSVRQPAAYCGVPGLKPTYGRISRWGLVAFASSLDHVALFARDAADLAAALAVTAGADGHDSTALDEPVPDYPAALGAGIAGLRVGVPREYFGDGIDAEVGAAVRAALDDIARLGAEPVPVELPHTHLAIPTYYLICTSEASSNLARYDGVRYGRRAGGGHDLQELYTETRAAGFGPEVKLRILLGTFCLRSGYYDAYYKKATAVRSLLRRDFEAAFARCDLIAGPTAPTAAFALGEKVDDPLAMYLQDVLTAPANLAGIPAVSLPCGHTAAGLPIGLQLQAPPLGEALLLRAADAYLREHAHHEVAPAR